MIEEVEKTSLVAPNEDMVLFALQEDRSKDAKSHMSVLEENRKWVMCDQTRTDASQGFYKDRVGAQGLNLFTRSELADLELERASRERATREHYVSAGKTLSRVMAATTTSDAQSGASTNHASSKRPRAKSAVPHAGNKLNDVMARAWMDRVDTEQRSKSAVIKRQLLQDAQRLDSTSSRALEHATMTIEKITSTRNTRRSNAAAGGCDASEGEIGRGSRGRRHRDALEDKCGAPDANSKQADASQRELVKDTARPGTRALSATLRSSLNKSKELDGKARVWDMSGGLHLTGRRKDMRSPFHEPKQKRHDPEGFYSNTMRPASAAPVLTSPTRDTEAHTGKMLGGNSVGSLRYPSGAPETAPHRGEMREDVYAVGSHWNYRFKNKHKHTAAREYGSPMRPKSAYPDLSPSIAKENLEAISEKPSARENKKETANVTWGVNPKSHRRAQSPVASARSKESAPNKSSAQEATGMSVSVGKDGSGDENAGGEPVGSASDNGHIVWEGLDGESISPRQYHRKRTDLTSRGQVRMGYGIYNKQSVLPLKSPAPSHAYGLKTLQEKRMKQKQFVEDIAAATQLQRPKTPAYMPANSALPMNRPSENNWAFQTIYLPKQLASWNPGNVSKVIRNIEYGRERPTFGPHFNSN